MIDDASLGRFKSYAERLQEEKQTLTFFITTQDTATNQSYYYYLVISALLYDRFVKAMEMGVIPDFAVIVERGPGMPSQAIKDKMKLYYGFDHDKQVEEGNFPFNNDNAAQ